VRRLVQIVVLTTILGSMSTASTEWVEESALMADSGLRNFMNKLEAGLVSSSPRRAVFDRSAYAF
jgi:hypothetical protein